MKPNELKDLILGLGFVPLYTNTDLEVMKSVLGVLARAAERAKFKQLPFELTCRNSNWAAQLSALVDMAAKEFTGRFVIGTGSCMHAEAVKIMHDHGSQFVVSHAHPAGMRAECEKYGMSAVLAGSTAGELFRIDGDFGKADGFMKFFPSIAGARYLQSAIEPFGAGDVFGDARLVLGRRFIIPTGLGPADAENPKPWFEVQGDRARVAALGLSGAVLQRSLIEVKDWAGLEEKCYSFMSRVREAKGK